VHKSSPLRVLFLCTRNAARSQIAEAIMTQQISRLKSRAFVVASAGSDPASEVHPWALRVLAERGIDWSGHYPKGIDAVRQMPWDLIITVCDQAKETCPIIPGQPAFAHWGMDDPSDAAGDDESRHRAFRDTATYLNRRIELLLALPVDALERRALEARVQQIARDVPVPRAHSPASGTTE